MTRSAPVLAIALCAAAVGCGKKDKPKEAPEPTLGSATPGSGSGSATGSAPVVPAGACADPCLLLKDGDLAAARTTCPDWSLGKDPAACEDLDYTRNCIYAAYGYTFKKDQWKQAFGAKPWYKPDPAFKDDAMSKAALANVAELKKLAAACRAHNEDQISPKTRDVVEAWFALRNKGQIPPLPDTLTDLEGLTIEKDEFIKKYLTDKDDQLFIKDKWEPIEWVKKDGKAEVVSVSTGVPDPSKCTEEGEECEGFETIEFSVEGDAITAITTFAAACPFVYQLDAGGDWRYRGEILKHLADPGAEATRSLALGDVDCSATRVVRISEEKREITYLDSVALAIDGAVIAPDGCGEGAMCADDGRYLVLATGGAIELRFTLPAVSCAAGAVVADGYYVPVRP